MQILKKKKNAVPSLLLSSAHAPQSPPPASTRTSVSSIPSASGSALPAAWVLMGAHLLLPLGHRALQWAVNPPLFQGRGPGSCALSTSGRQGARDMRASQLPAAWILAEPLHCDRAVLQTSLARH